MHADSGPSGIGTTTHRGERWGTPSSPFETCLSLLVPLTPPPSLFFLHRLDMTTGCEVYYSILEASTSWVRQMIRLLECGTTRIDAVKRFSVPIHTLSPHSVSQKYISSLSLSLSLSPLFKGTISSRSTGNGIGVLVLDLLKFSVTVFILKLGHQFHALLNVCSF